MGSKKYSILIPIFLLFFVCGVGSVRAEDGVSVLYVPLVGISVVPEPLALPKGPGEVQYQYAVKNFLREKPLSNVTVTDDTCSPITFTEGDDDTDSRLDYSETWRYTCTLKLSNTTQSVATVTGTTDNLTATHKAHATVFVGSDIAPPLVNIINVTKVAYPLALPAGGGDITFTYRVNNPGVVPLHNVIVTDNKCSAMSKKLGDTNGNNLLDTNEVWVYTCTTHLTETTTNTATVTSHGSGLQAIGYSTITVTVASSSASTEAVPGFPATGINVDSKIITWGILSSILGVLIMFFIFKKSNEPKNNE